MKYCSDYTLHSFVKEFVSSLKKENECREPNGVKFNIPFLISTLCQSFNNDESLYKQFISDLKECSYYDIYIDDLRPTYKTTCTAIVCFHNDVCEDDYGYTEELNFQYEITFSSSERYYQYCECTPDDPDYREDKHCCGHGCDWDAPNFTMRKSLLVSSQTWDGDEHDYWDFEDKFYADDKEENEKKLISERECEIRNFKETIKNAQKKLKELEKNLENL